MDIGDVEGDIDMDILLGALDFSTNVPPTLFQKWQQDKTSILILKNSTRTHPNNILPSD